MRFSFRAALLSCALFGAATISSAHAADAAKPTPAAGTNDDHFTGVAALLPADSVTKHHYGSIAYTAHAGTLTLRDAKGAPSARVFYVAYTKDGATAAKRPVAFFFNGGPGGGTAYLHLGAAGPVALTMPSKDPTDGAHATLGDNPDSWLPGTDMVFIDAIGTGYSRATDPTKAAAQFYGVKQDASAFAKVIQLWIAQNNRQESPHYLVGESYGGIRAIQVANALQMEQNTLLDGLVMLSPAIEMPLLDTEDNPLSAALMLPTLISAHQSPNTTPESADAAYQWAMSTYLTKIAGRLTDKDSAFYHDVAERTGLPESVITRQHGVPAVGSHDVMSIDGRLHGLYDYTQTIADPAADGLDESPDPTLFGFGRAYGNAFSGYAANALGFHTPLTYDLLSLSVNASWKWSEGGPSPVHQIPVLNRLLALNPSMRIFVANGYYDLACPFGTAHWLKDHLTVGSERVSLHLYQGGHMLYLRPESRHAFASDVQKWLEADTH
ncbi:peptidase S10 serine carboxypeptidase [Neokomagataea thailandica NBRC 106555]|uniref:Peptidase S10 n=2 Tax=Neokomagataea TaxID=1223423 RepID=A0A4Y6V6R7_9PROT|nr:MULTISPECIES: alpha/beta hydrolase [Neokomagataea]QDH24350.1 peptidase S10 [Neokomagataea tanensis]GBR53231.1 peptidase S10 serine carboxypeptidase [Neokomagataea thailandica NBRC 106555]